MDHEMPKQPMIQTVFVDHTLSMNVCSVYTKAHEFLAILDCVSIAGNVCLLVSVTV